MSGETNLAILLATLKPVMAAPVYVYCTFAEGHLPPGLSALCTLHEVEGLTAVVTRDDAQHHGLAYVYEARLITLDVHSSLDAVGFIACISRVLAEERISCNVIAGYFHDHLLVPANRADDTMGALERLAASAG